MKNSSANRIAKKKKKNQPSANLSSFHLSSEQNAATLSTQLHYGERQFFVPDWISKRDTRTSLSPSLPPLIYDEAIEKSPRLSAILYPPTVLDAVLPPPESSLLLHPLRFHPDILSSSLSVGSSVDKGGWITGGGEETISRGASLRSTHVSFGTTRNAQ